MDEELLHLLQRAAAMLYAIAENLESSPYTQEITAALADEIAELIEDRT